MAKVSQTNAAETGFAWSSTTEALPQGRNYEGVVEQIHQLIRDGHLKPGDKLPPEHKLMADFGVGRSSIRDAIRVLEVMGAVKVRQGGGTVVQDVSPRTIVIPLATMLSRRRALVAELMDLRLILEPPLARRAAKSVTAQDIAHLEEVLDRQREKVTLGQPAVEEDAEFHGIIARAGGNQVVLNVLDVLMELLQETRAQSLQLKTRSRQSVSSHGRILGALRKRDPAAAEAAMRNHIRSVEQTVRKRLMKRP